MSDGTILWQRITTKAASYWISHSPIGIFDLVDAYDSTRFACVTMHRMRLSKEEAYPNPAL